MQRIFFKSYEAFKTNHFKRYTVWAWGDGTCDHIISYTVWAWGNLWSHYLHHDTSLRQEYCLPTHIETANSLREKLSIQVRPRPAPYFIPRPSLFNYVLNKLFERLQQLEPCCLLWKSNIHNQELIFLQVTRFCSAGRQFWFGWFVAFETWNNKQCKFWITTNFWRFTRTKHVKNSRICNQSLQFFLCSGLNSQMVPAVSDWRRKLKKKNFTEW